jgi:hypothetical protein
MEILCSVSSCVNQLRDKKKNIYIFLSLGKKKKKKESRIKMSDENNILIFVKTCNFYKPKLYVSFRHPFRFGHWNGIFRYWSIPAFRFGFTAKIYIYIYIN